MPQHNYRIYALTQSDLGVAFPGIVKAFWEQHPDQLNFFLNQFYGEQYNLIQPDPSLVKAFHLAAEKGIQIYIYTNGPSGKIPDDTLHVQKVFKQLGFSSQDIEHLRPRTYDLIYAIHSGRGKPAEESMADFLNFSSIDPDQALMADDNLKNLMTAAKYGIEPLWTWTSHPPKKNDDLSIARTQHTGETLLRIAQNYNPA